MRLNDETIDLKLRITPAYGQKPLMLDEVASTNKRKRILSYILTFLIILLVITTTSFVLFNSDISYEYHKFRSTFVSKFAKSDSNDDESSDNLKRQFNSSNLSYYSDTELGKLGVLSLPKNLEVQEIYKGIRFVSSKKKNFSDLQIRLLKKFIDNTPYVLLQPGPTAIINFEKGEIQQGINFNPNTVAFASGSYIFFNDESFNPSFPLADNSVDAAFSTFIHELTHVSQFNHVTKNLTLIDIDNTYVLGYTWIDLVINSDLIEDFASYTSWTKTYNNGKVSYELVNKENEKTTDYGKTEIYEDMAETISSVIATNFSKISSSRIEWALKYLNTNISELKFGKFPFSEKYDQVSASNLVYDTSKDSEYKKSFIYSDKQVFINQNVNTIDDIAEYMSNELNIRGWSGKFLKSSDKSNVIRYIGEFTGAYRDMYIEMYTYDQAKGFYVKPKGTIIVVINGYFNKGNSI